MNGAAVVDVDGEADRERGGGAEQRWAVTAGLLAYSRSRICPVVIQEYWVAVTGTGTDMAAGMAVTPMAALDPAVAVAVLYAVVRARAVTVTVVPCWTAAAGSVTLAATAVVVRLPPCWTAAAPGEAVTATAAAVRMVSVRSDVAGNAVLPASAVTVARLPGA